LVFILNVKKEMDRDLNELFQEKRNQTTLLSRLVEVGEGEKRELNADELAQFETIKDEIRALDLQINAKNENTITIKQEKRMTNFNELIVRSNGTIENFSTRAVVLASGIDNVTVAGDISAVGYEPFYKQMGVSILPNLTGSIKLPFVNGIIAAKKGEGVRNDNDKTVSTVLLQPTRFTITETIGKELLAVGNESALQAFLFEMVKGCDKAVTKEIFDVAIAGASAQAGLTEYTTANIDTLVANVDGDVTILMPRSEFYKAKGVAVGTATGKYLAEKTSQFAGNLWDGTPLFYSALFANSTIVAADLKHITVGEFGSEYEVIFDNFSKAPEGQVVVTVCKTAGVVLRNTAAVKKALIA